MSDHPRVENAPGIVWRKRQNGWTAMWQCRTDLAAKGFLPTSTRIWHGGSPTEAEQQFISDVCSRLQHEMLTWSRGGVPGLRPFEGTLASLVYCYQSDPDSNYRRVRFNTREYYDYLCRVVVRDHGDERLADINGRSLRHWHSEWVEGGRIAMAHALVGMLRTLTTFGTTLLDDKDCQRIKGLLHDLRFTMAKPRTERLTADQANLIRAKAHEMGKPSIALAQAFQFEAMLRQKDVIGEWVPIAEPGTSDVLHGQSKWLRGIRWSEIDANLILRHTTSKRQKDIEIDLKLAPMVIEELARLNDHPSVGPVIICEGEDEVPWTNHEFRRWWRRIARACGVPDAVRNMDSRAGAITEATEAGAELEHIKHAAAHSDIAMTQKYARGQAEKTSGVARKRIAFRNKTGTE